MEAVFVATSCLQSTREWDMSSQSRHPVDLYYNPRGGFMGMWHYECGYCVIGKHLSRHSAAWLAFWLIHHQTLGLPVKIEWPNKDYFAVSGRKTICSHVHWSVPHPPLLELLVSWFTVSRRSGGSSSICHMAQSIVTNLWEVPNCQENLTCFVPADSIISSLWNIEMIAIWYFVNLIHLWQSSTSPHNIGNLFE